MATKKLVPRATNEGGLGTALKVWGPSWLQNLTITNLQTSTSTSVLVETAGYVEKRNAGGLCTDVVDTESATTWVGLYEEATGCLMPFTDEQFRYDASAGKLYLGGTGTADSLTIWNQNIFSHADFIIESGNTSSITLFSTQGTTFFAGVGGAATMNISGTGLFINNIPIEASPVHVLVDNATTPGLVSKGTISTMGISVQDTNDTTCWVGLWEDATGTLLPKTDGEIRYNATLDALMIGSAGTDLWTQSGWISQYGQNLNLKALGHIIVTANGGKISLRTGIGLPVTSFYDNMGTWCHILQNETAPINIITEAVPGGGSTNIPLGMNGFLAKTPWTDFAPNLISKDEGVTLTNTTTSIDYVGAGVTTTVVGTDTTVTIPGAAVTFPVDDEGTQITAGAINMDFVGTGVTATSAGNNVTVTIPGGGSSVVADTISNACFVGLWEAATGTLDPKTDEVFKYDAWNKFLYSPKNLYCNTNTVGPATDFEIAAETAAPSVLTDTPGGMINLRGSGGSGAGSGGGVNIYGTRKTISGTSMHTLAYIAKFQATGSTGQTSTFTLWDPASISPTDYFRITCTAAGASVISTKDVAAFAAHLTLNADGDIKYDSATGNHFWYDAGTNLMNVTNGGLFVDNIPTEAAPVNILVDNVATPGLFSKAAISSLPSSLQSLNAGVSLTTTTASVDYTGAGVTASVVGNAVTVDIPGSTNITLTTTGTSGASTWNGTTLNIPQYAGGGGGVTDISSTDGVASSGEAITVNSTQAGSVTVDVFAYNGAANVGYVPSGGTAGTFLEGDGTWGTLTLNVADTEDSTCYVGLWESATGNLEPKTDEGLTYNATTGSEVLTLVGDMDITGNGTTNNILDIINTTLTTGTALNVVQPSGGKEFTTPFVNFEVNETDNDVDASSAGQIQNILWKKTGTTGSGITQYRYGSKISMWDQAANDVNATMWHIGSYITVGWWNNNGAQNAIGLNLDVCSNGVGDPSNIKGIQIATINDGYDIYMKSPAGGVAWLRTLLNGETELKADGQAAGAGLAHINIDADGEINFKRDSTLEATVESLRVESFMMACSDETSALVQGNDKVKFRMPYAFTVTEVRASLSTAGTGANLVTVDINEAGTTILSTKITIDATETTSQTAATAPVISDTALADDAEISIDIDQIDSGGVSAGLKVAIIGYKTV